MIKEKKEAKLLLKESEQIFVCPNIYPDELIAREINMDYYNPISNKELRNFDVLFMD